MKPFRVTSLLSPDQVNQTFQRHFSYLKLQLAWDVNRPLPDEQAAMALQQLPPGDRSVRWLVVDPAMSVNAFEVAFQYTFGLSAQVLRRSGYTWDDLENTRHWSLQDQNQKGRQMTRSLGANV